MLILFFFRWVQTLTKYHGEILSEEEAHKENSWSHSPTSTVMTWRRIFLVICIVFLLWWMTSRETSISPERAMRLHVHTRTYAHVSTDDDGEDKDTRHLRYDSCNVATDVRGRGEEEGGRQTGKMCMCLSARICVLYKKGVLPLPRVSLIDLHYIFRNCRTSG